MLFHPESDSYIYLMRVKDLLESRRRGRMSEKDRLHYDLMLRKINATLSVE
jgi:hypothetical protein